ncbi:RICIN domain-containing protein [Paractinoplanes lichenicola]|uniref:RICIN domain-containing protein n=1 Tax=Paractinoplanes lichenicola TaxID=2802976 RepID=A0ABS1VUK4_9ACTN|nr:RICIN domain-containing protein [Actinoplanes lichenicola]MBL7258117.1 RICIN domain-containing protein [Actinoplanes lichenicola]
MDKPRRWRAALIGLVVTLLAGAGVLFGLPTAQAATVNTAAWYVLVNRNSGKAMDVYNLATNAGAGIAQFTRNDGNWQQWQFVDAGSGYYKIKSRHSGLVLELPNANDGTQLIQNTDNGTTRQHFTLKDSAGGYVRLLNRHSGKAVETWEWSTADGGIVAQYGDLDGANQQWQMVQVGTGGGSTSGCGSGTFQSEVTVSGSTWTARNASGASVYSGTDFRAAVQAGIGSLTAGRTSIQRVVVRGNGSMTAGSRISLASYTSLSVCGTINVTGSGSGDYAPIYARGVSNIEVPYLNVTGAPIYGIFMRNVTNVWLGQIDMRLSAGLGVRIDNRGDTSQWTRNVKVDSVYVSGASSHAMETYGVDGITIGTVTARNVGESGLLLNQTINATVGTVDAENAGAGTGYAAFRMANRNGRVGDSYPNNIKVGTVKARGGGRGVFCVSESGGATIDRVDIANTGNNSVLVENCYNVVIAGVSGTISGGGEVRIAARTEFAPSSGISFRNLTVSNTNITWSPCTGSNNTISNVTRSNSTLTWC